MLILGDEQKTYTKKFYSDTGCSLEDLTRAMEDGDEWCVCVLERERERERESETEPSGF